MDNIARHSTLQEQSVARGKVGLASISAVQLSLTVLGPAGSLQDNFLHQRRVGSCPQHRGTERALSRGQPAPPSFISSGRLSTQGGGDVRRAGDPPAEWRCPWRTYRPSPQREPGCGIGDLLEPGMVQDDARPSKTQRPPRTECPLALLRGLEAVGYFRVRALSGSLGEGHGCVQSLHVRALLLYRFVSCRPLCAHARR